MGSIVLGARVGLAAMFAVAGLAKLKDLPGTRRSLTGFGVPARALSLVGLLLPLAELATAIALVPTPLARAGAVAALVLLVAFTAGIAHAMWQGQAPDCHCFGQLHLAPAGRGTIARNAGFAALATFVVIDGPGPSIDSWLAARTAAEIVAVAATAAAVGLALSALRQRATAGTLRAELTAAQAELAVLPGGLPVNAVAPRFNLLDLSGVERTLESILDRGQPLLLIFMSPDCRTCGEMLPEVRRWQSTLADRLSIAVITHGAGATNRAMLDEHGIADVMLQQDTELMKSFRIRLTPTAVLLTPDGRIANPLAEGALAIEPLIRLTLRRRLSMAATTPGVRQPA